MIRNIYLIAFVTLTLICPSLPTLASGDKDLTPPEQTERTQETANDTRAQSKTSETDNVDLSSGEALDALLDEALNEIFYLKFEDSALECLTPALLQRIEKHLDSKDVLNWISTSKIFLKFIVSHCNSKLTLENKVLTESDFLHYFGENGLYKEAQHLSLRGSCFHPKWLRHLPKTLKTLSLSRVNTKTFRQYGFNDSSSMKIEMVKALALPKLKFLDIQDLDIRSKNLRKDEFRHIIEHLATLPSLNSLNISGNNLGRSGASYLAKNLKKLTSLSISGSGVGDEGIAHIAENLQSLTFLEAEVTGIGGKGFVDIVKNLKSLIYLKVSGNYIGALWDPNIAEHLKSLRSLTLLEIAGNYFEEEEQKSIFRQELPSSCKIVFE